MADKRSEAIEIKRMGGKAQKNSGRGRYHKGDAILEPFCVDVKEFKENFGISKKVWAKISTDAQRSGDYEPALMLALGDPALRLWVIGDEMFHELLDCWRNHYG